MSLFKNKLKKLRLAVLASGRGSNFQSIHRAIKKGSLKAEIVLLASDNPEAGAMHYAASHKIPFICCDAREYPSRSLFESDLIKHLHSANADLIILAGFMRVLSQDFVATFASRIINIHPSLLPSFPGLRAQKQALDYGVKHTGCTVHFVDSGVDTGPIILQKTVPVLEGDTEITLSLRILKEEHKLYWRALRLIAENKISIIGRKVFIKGAK